MKCYNLISLILLLIIATSCQKKIDKEEAMEIIKRDFRANYCGDDRFINLRAEFIEGRTNENPNKKLKIFKELESKGLVTLKKRVIYNTSYRIELTSEGKKKYFYNNEIAITIENVDEIIGISHEKDKAIVICKMSNKRTPFYPLFTREDVCSTNSFQKEFILTKFDTGWRLSQN